MNINEIKSTEGIDICWVEEANKVSEESWVVLIPTIRKANSEIIVTFNPDEEKDPAYQRFVMHPPPNSVIEEINYVDNAFFPEVLRQEMEYCKRVDPDAYKNIWMGKLKKYSDALIFKNKLFFEEFEPPAGVQFYYGADFGYSVDAMWMGRCFILDKSLYICDEVYGVGIEIGELHKAYETVPDSHSWQIRADSARPDTINFLSQPTVGKDGIEYKGFNIIGAEKGKGSVEDGLEFLRSFERIVIHTTRCPGAKANFENYRWKKDKITGEILPIPVDKNNHAPDGIRYALEPYIKQKKTIFDVL
jgi:phage terminase large subunit